MKNFYNGKPCGCNSPSDSYYRAPNMSKKFKRLLCVSPEYADSINDLDTLLCGKFLPIRGGAHDRFKTYEDFTIVYDAETLVAYLSKKEVPYGVEITNREYWQPMNVTGYADDNVIILNDKNVSGLIIPYTLETATKSIAEVARKLGKVLMFFSLEGGAHWEMWQFFGLDVSDWEDVSQWRSIYNVWNKFVGWYNTTEELYQLQVYPIDGKYAIVGPTIRDAVIYEGTPGGWIPLDTNLYQKFLNDFLKLIDEGVIVLTECQKDILKEWFKEMGIGCDCDHGEGKNDWGWAGRPYTDFIVKAAFECDSDLKLTYPTSIYHDASDLESVGNPALHSITVDNEDMENLNLHFTAGAWNDIMNGNSIYRTDDKDVEGFLDISFTDSVPNGLQITVDDNIVKPFTNGWKVACDGHQHIITLIKPNTCKVTINYYDSVTGKIKTKTMEVPYGEPMTAPTITDAIYTGHTFTGWATNNSIISDPDNSFDVVDRTSAVPAYFDFTSDITSDKVLYAWYTIDAVFTWNDNGGAHSETISVPYNTTITNTPSVGELTGYTFQGWVFNDTTVPVGQGVGPIVKPVNISGDYAQDIPEYNYKVTNSTSTPMQVVVGGQVQTIPANSSKTYTLPTSSAILTINTAVPTGDNLTNSWTIDGTKSNSKTVNAGNVVIGMETIYNYKVINNTGQSTISVKVGAQTKNVTTNTVYSMANSSTTASVMTAAPTGYAWAINNSQNNSVPVNPGNIYVTLNDIRTTYDYVVVNESGMRVSVTVGDLTNDVVNHETYTLYTDTATVVINTPAPTGYVWTINDVEGSSANNLTPGTITIGLAVGEPPTIDESVDLGFYDEYNYPATNPADSVPYSYSHANDVHNIRLDYEVSFGYNDDSVRVGKVRLVAGVPLTSLKLAFYIVDSSQSTSIYDISDLGPKIAEAPLTFVSGSYEGFNSSTLARESGNTSASTQSILISNIGIVDIVTWTTLFNYTVPQSVLDALTEGKSIIGVVDNCISANSAGNHNESTTFSYELPDL